MKVHCTVGRGNNKVRGNRAKSKSASNDRSEDDGKQSAAFGSFEAASSAKHKGPIVAMCHVGTSIAGPGARRFSGSECEYPSQSWNDDDHNEDWLFVLLRQSCARVVTLRSGRWLRLDSEDGCTACRGSDAPDHVRIPPTSDLKVFTAHRTAQVSHGLCCQLESVPTIGTGWYLARMIAVSSRRTPPVLLMKRLQPRNGWCELDDRRREVIKTMTRT